jgi:hypothetical protein
MRNYCVYLYAISFILIVYESQQIYRTWFNL